MNLLHQAYTRLQCREVIVFIMDSTGCKYDLGVNDSIFDLMQYDSIQSSVSVM